VLGLTKLAQAVIGLGVLSGAAALALLAPQQSPAVHSHGVLPKYYGVNLPSATFGKKRGDYGKDYVYPSSAVAEPFQTMGMNAVRLGFLWGRLQHEPFGELDADELGHLDQAVNDLSGFQLIMLDLHNYGRYKGKKIDDPATGGAQLADLWTKLATHYKGNPRVAFGIMNEPNGIDAGAWRRVADQAVAAVRHTGARNLVLVPGTNWTGGHSWDSGHDGSNATAMSGFRDPGGNFAFEIHQYLDSDSSGTHPDCVDAGVGRRRLAGVTRWLRAQHARGFLAEFGVSSSPVCLQALDDTLDFLDENGDVWVGWTYWAGGARWHNYPFDIQPKHGETKPQAEVLQRHIDLYRRSAAR
jgi:endoglucanase